MILSEIFDGEIHFVESADFSAPAVTVVKSVDFDEDEELNQWEAPTAYVTFEDKPSHYPAGKPEGVDEEQGWACLVIALHSLSTILGGTHKGYQYNRYDDKTKKISERSYSFQFVPGDQGHQGGRI